MDVQSSPSFKLRALLRKLRPLFLEVLGTPDFRNCDAAKEICKELKLLKELHKQVVLEAGKQSCGSEPGFVPIKEGEERKQRKPGQCNEFVPKPMESCSEKKQKTTSSFGGDGTYIVGGSVLGWNFIAFPGSKPVYYGVKKESFRRKQKGAKF